jgi:hypothetical protein
LIRLHDTDLLAIVADDAHFGHTDALVDAGRIPLGRAPIEPTRNRH